MSSCHLCGEEKLLALLDFGEHPIAHRFVTDLSVQEYVHPVRLCFCENCGLIQLDDPIPPEKLYTTYSWLSAWKPQLHIPRLVSLISQLPGISAESKFLEAGCNDGTFLKALEESGYHNAIGIEPARDAVEAARREGLEVINDYFGLRAARNLVESFGEFDVLVTRQVLEHVIALKGFREGIRATLKIGGHALIEVPNFEFSLRTMDYSAIWEEHVNHFTLYTLSRFLADGGFRVVHTETAPFCGEALIVIAQYLGTPVSLSSFEVEQARAKAFAYRDHWSRYQRGLINYLREYRATGRKVAVYGAGCRACCLINYAGLAPYVDIVFDDQSEKQGKYMPGSHLCIYPGELLEQNSVDLCLLAVNAENEERVVSKHQTYLAKGGRFASVLPPSNRLLDIELP